MERTWWRRKGAARVRWVNGGRGTDGVGMERKSDGSIRPPDAML